MNRTGEIHANTYLNILNELFPEITEEFESIENGEKTLDNVQSTRFIDKIKKTVAKLKQIDTYALRDIVDEATINKIERDINYMHEELLYMQKRLLADEYIEDLRTPIRKYIKRMNEDPRDYKKWAKDEEILTDKFIGMLMHPDNIDSYMHQIKRMALGTMSQKEFNKIFNVAKHKMIPNLAPKFESFISYKERKGHVRFV